MIGRTNNCPICYLWFHVNNIKLLSYPDLNVMTQILRKKRVKKKTEINMKKQKIYIFSLKKVKPDKMRLWIKSMYMRHMYSKYVCLTSIRDDFLTNRSGKIMTDQLLFFILLLREGKRSLISVSYMLLLLLLWRAWGISYVCWY